MSAKGRRGTVQHQTVDVAKEEPAEENTQSPDPREPHCIATEGRRTVQSLRKGLMCQIEKEWEVSHAMAFCSSEAAYGSMSSRCGEA